MSAVSANHHPSGDLAIAPLSDSTPPPTLALQPPVRLMIVILPDHLPPRSAAASLTGSHPALAGVPVAYLWARRGLHRWQRRHLTGPRHSGRHRPMLCAGGPVRLVDLDGMRAAAGYAARLRQQWWTDTVRGTRPAKPWHELAADATAATPASWTQARRRFLQQPRIAAMRAATAAHVTAPPLDPDELEMFQAGPAAYQHYHAMRAVCGDAMLTVTGDLLRPHSDSLTDRISYLQQAMRLLHAVPDQQPLLAVSPHPTTADPMCGMPAGNPPVRPMQANSARP